ncbi:MAG TPA: tetraacyldisaccharide 4'-kinase [Xanthobacteraceae bacterium]|nr:tetraacyldisaccharide 4'-kinase [Xanthobacteraceae bacterium]
MREPAFWWRAAGLAAALLSPLAAIYGAVAAARLRQRGARAGVPVICVGNFTVGGAGKTPAAIAVAQMLAAAGERPVFLSRGYGGTLSGVRVDPARHRAADVGDEPLLLARAAPVVVARDRVAGAQLAATEGASVIVMDDGFQNPSLAKDFSLLVVDARRGIGNGRVIPAGPLRAPLAAQLAHTDALLVIGSGSAADDVVKQASARALPAFAARLQPDARFLAALGGGRALAFAGIGDPQKFFATLAEAGIALGATRSFPDHHRYTRNEAQALCDEAGRADLVLVTTEKDLARMAGDDAAASLAARALALPVTLAIEGVERFRSLVMERVAAARRR